MIDKINHYSLTNPASVYDEEAMTALELAGRTAAKVNECVEAVNEHEKYTEERLDAQDKLIPVKVKTAVQDCIDDGSFDDAIAEYAGELEDRLDSLVANSGNDNTEIVDARTDADGNTHGTLRASIIAQDDALNRHRNAFAYVASDGDVKISNDITVSGDTVVHFENLLNVVHSGGSIMGQAWETIGSELGDLITIDGDKADITIGERHVLVINLTDSKLYVRGYADVKVDDVVLLSNGYAQAVRGDLITAFTRKRLNALENSRSIDKFSKAIFYIGSDGDVQITKNDSTGQLVVTVANNLVVRGADFSTSFAWADITDAIASRCTYDGNAVTITISQFNRVLVFNMTDKKVYERNFDSVKIDDVVLLSNGYANAIDGVLYHKWIEKRVDKALANAETGATFEIPDSVKRFAGKIATASDNAETFVFFTDPHLCEGDDWKAKFDRYMTYLKNVVDSTPASLVISGGDWIGNSDSTADACFKLGYVDGQLRKLFGDRYISVIGNHDTNYQGDAQLSEDALNMLCHREHGRAYFTYETRTTKFIVLDTDVDWIDYQDETYFDRQRVFLRDELMNTNKHVIVVAHMYTIDGTTVNSLSADAFDMCTAYNSRSDVTVGTIGMSFANGAGYVEAILTGHTHADNVIATEGSPVVIVTTRMQDGNVPTFDLALIDYDARKLHLVREGTGSDRTITLDGDGETGSLPDSSGGSATVVTDERVETLADLLLENSATAGQILTANGEGGATWEDAPSGDSGTGAETASVTVTYSDSPYDNLTLKVTLTDTDDSLGTLNEGESKTFTVNKGTSISLWGEGCMVSAWNSVSNTGACEPFGNTPGYHVTVNGDCTIVGYPYEDA